MVKTYKTVGYHSMYDAEVLYKGTSKKQAMDATSQPSREPFFSVFVWENDRVIKTHFKSEK